MKKPIYKSKSMWAAGIIALTAILSYFGIDLPTETIITLAGALGVYGIRDAIDKNK